MSAQHIEVMDKAIHGLRIALACISTELDKDKPDVEGIWQIAEDALNWSRPLVKPKIGKCLSDPSENGVEYWRLYPLDPLPQETTP